MRPGGSPGFLYFRLSLRFARGLCARSLVPDGFGCGLVFCSLLRRSTGRSGGGWWLVVGWLG
jgi:hypothetical protein